ncbi:transcriptional regulator [Deinococcus aetherius]|uniref:Transcriptional regulator n=1 Tax=Deinococcus aetherius TaxID=200252 RepID=A0ABM8AEP3_9DEIO|nr:putative glycolipid-binding domain-containing protein [Deinococcus aetherius]BDP42129.1 transcriptional regulator [Deinococcus aetherius]
MDVLWRGVDSRGESLEHLRLGASRARGTVIGRAGAGVFTLGYVVEIDPDGHPRLTTLRVVDGPTLQLRRSWDGGWSDDHGRPLPELTGCTDVDIQATPFTNTLPLRRLNLPVGAGAVVLAAWVGVPELGVRAVPQRYTRLAEHTYRYENLESGYAVEITVDAQGLVTRYPGAFERVGPGQQS